MLSKNLEKWFDLFLCRDAAKKNDLAVSPF
jgi:hypothetical protein